MQTRHLLACLAAGVFCFTLASVSPAEDIDGTDNADTLTGTDGEDEITGLDGDDIIRALDGNDLVHGGDGADTIDGGAGDDTLNGNQHNDTIDGGGGNDTINTGPGGNVAHGGAGNDTITSAHSWPSSGTDGYPATNTNYPAEGQAEFRLADEGILNQAWGGEGNDYLEAKNVLGWQGWGGSFHFLHGGTGADILEGGGGQDLIVIQGNDDTVITGPYEDVVAIVGNSVEGYTFYDALKYLPSGDVEKDEHGNPIDFNNGTDMICFVRDVNPQQLTMISVFASGSWKQFMEFDTGLPTRDPVHLDLNEHPMLKNFEAFRTGDGDDTLVGRDYGSPDGPQVPPSYGVRLKGAFKGPLYQNDPDDLSWLYLHELFFTGAGNDTVTTGRGNDLVDLGEGNDTVYLGPDNCFVITGAGNDTVQLDAAVMNGSDSPNPDGGKIRIADFAGGDKVVLTGVTAEQVTFEQTTMPDNKGGALLGQTFTIVKIDGVEQFVLMNRTASDLAVQNVGGKATLTMKPTRPEEELATPDDIKGPGKETKGDGDPPRVIRPDGGARR
ncbi:MAG: calcium-binding protein [Planctomycetota bacterium]